MSVFSPVGDAIVISATQTSSVTALPISGGVMRIANNGPNEVFLKFTNGIGVVTASNGFLLPANEIDYFRTPSGATHLAAICTTGETAGVNVQSGELA